MSTTGAKAPTAAQTISEAPWSDETWANPQNIYGAGETNVTGTGYDAGDQTYVLKAYTFDFSSIPAGAVIDGITVVINARYATALASIDLCQLLNISRAKVGTNLASAPVALTTSAANYTFGSASNLWGNVLTRTWVQDPDFGVAIGCLAGGSGNNNVDVYIDSVTMEITWHINLAMANAQHDLVSESPILEQNHILAVANTLHELSSEGLSLIEHKTLAVADAVHNVESESPTLIETVNLVVANAAHALASELVDLIEHKVLEVANAQHDLSSEEPVLIKNSILVIDDSTHELTSDVITLDELVTLVVNDTIHNISSENVHLVPAVLPGTTRRGSDGFGFSFRVGWRF